MDNEDVKDLQEEITQLKNRIESLEAQGIGAHWEAYKKLTDLIKKDFTGSALILEIRSLSGKSLVGPVSITDGLSRHILEALRSEVKRSQENSLSLFAIRE